MDALCLAALLEKDDPEREFIKCSGFAGSCNKCYSYLNNFPFVYVNSASVTVCNI